MKSDLKTRHGGKILADALAAQGVKLAFGVPGESYLPVLDGLHDLQDRLRDIPVCSVHRTPFPGLARGAHLHAAAGPLLATLALGDRTVDSGWRDALLARDRRRRAALDALWTAHPRAEPGLVRALSEHVPAGSLVYLGNSLPIREWDLAAVRAAPGWTVGVNRGANGIDGQLSTFLGMCGPGREHWALVGDLTALYDLGAPWILGSLATGPIRLVVVNNGGGQIFRRLFPYPELRNAHARGFAPWAAMWDLEYVRWDAVPESTVLPDRVVIELVPDADATDRFWRAYDALD